MLPSQVHNEAASVPPGSNRPYVSLGKKAGDLKLSGPHLPVSARITYEISEDHACGRNWERPEDSKQTVKVCVCVLNHLCHLL